MFQQVPLPPTTVTQGTSETVRVYNADDVDVGLTRIEAMQQPHQASTLSVMVPAGGTHVLESGRFATTNVWTRETVCPAGMGVYLTAQQSGSTQPHRFTVLCGAAASYTSTETNNSQKRKRKKEQQRQRRDRQRNAQQRRRDHKH
jgi:predicted nucleic acid-binding Zn ribbon protein